MESFRYPSVFNLIFILFLNAFPLSQLESKEYPVNLEKKINQEKLKLSYLCFRKDFLPTHFFNYLKEEKELESNLLYVEDIMLDVAGELKYYLSFASHAEIWGNNDTNFVRSKIELAPYFEKHSERFLREKVFFEINQRIKQTRKENIKKQKLQKKITYKEEKKKEIVRVEKTKVESTYKEIKKGASSEETGNLANYLLIAGGVCLVLGLLKKAIS